MEKFSRDMKRKYVEDIGRVALEYLDNGREMYHRHLRGERDCMQSSIGMLGTGTELLLKSFISSKNLGAIFKDIPAEMRILLSSPESIPSFFEWYSYAIDLRSDRFPTIDLSECIAGFYIFFPQLKQMLVPHVDALIKRRFASHHGVLPAISRYELESIGYAVLHIIRALVDNEGFDVSWVSLSDDDLEFIQYFDRQRIERVKFAIHTAEKSATRIDHDRLDTIVANGWDSYVVQCPVCRSGSLLDGYTVLAVGGDEDGLSTNLDFFATSFHCDECGLDLLDSEEIKLVKLDTIFDRSAELDRWFSDHEDFSNWYLDESL